MVQGLAPEITLPTGVDLPALGEIGLRILGVPSGDAHTFAASIDWTNTLVLPIPPFASAFRNVDVNGQAGLWVGYQAPNESSTNLILWSREGRVYGLTSSQAWTEVLAMADSIP